MTSDGNIEIPMRGRDGRRNRSFAMLRTVAALILREMSTRYGRSPGGYVWAVLEPMGAILVLGIGFSLIIRSPPLGTSFLLFYATGYLPFHLYQTVSGTVMRAIVFSRALLFYPIVTWVDALLARFILNALTGILVIYLIIVGIVIATDVDVVLDVTAMLKATSLALFLGLGIGTLNCALLGLIRVWDVIWSILTRPLFLASGVFFTFDGLPQTVQSILWYNPLVHVVGFMRAGFYPMYSASYASEAFVFGTGIVTLFFGVVLLGRHHRDILNSN